MTIHPRSGEVVHKLPIEGTIYAVVITDAGKAAWYVSTDGGQLYKPLDKTTLNSQSMHKLALALDACAVDLLGHSRVAVATNTVTVQEEA